MILLGQGSYTQPQESTVRVLSQAQPAQATEVEQVPIQPRSLKLSGPIHAVKGKERFLVIRVLNDTQIVIPFSQLLDKSDPIWKKLAYVLQFATPIFLLTYLSDGFSSCWDDC